MTAIAAAVHTSKARVVFDGQSLNATPINHSYPRQLMTVLRSGVPWNNVAIGGTSWSTLDNTALQRTYSHAPLANYAILILCGGTSDILEGDDGATVVADMFNYSNAGRSGGFDYVIGTTITPNLAFTGGQESIRTSANGFILAAVPATFNAVVDFAADSRLSDASNLTYYNADGLHWTAAGADVAASLMAPALDVALALASAA